MRAMVLSGALTLLAATSLAQTSWAQTALSPAASEAEGPANLCQELLAFMKAPPPAAAADKPAATSAKATTAPQSGSTQEASSALAGTTAAHQGASAATDDKSGSAQAATGQDGVATDAPQSGEDKAASGSVQNAPQKDSRSAPIPPADMTSTSKDSVVTVEAVEQLSAANDIEQCQKSAREMRVAGVDMPPPLMALAALDLQYQQKSGAANAPAPTADPAVND